MAQTSRIAVRVESTLTSALDLVTAASDLDLNTRVDLADGSGAGQANMQWSDRRTLAASATEDLDLAGSLTGPVGGTLTFARVKAVLIKAAAANTNNVNVTRPAANGAPIFLAAGDGLPVKPGGLFLWVAPDATGVAVTAATGDLLTLTNSSAGTAVTYDIVVIGASA